jgi:hypothetical protein
MVGRVRHRCLSAEDPCRNPRLLFPRCRDLANAGRRGDARACGVSSATGRLSTPWKIRCSSKRRTSPPCRASLALPLPCRTPIGAMAFPSVGVAAFDAEAGGVVSAGGVGFDIACGVRTLLTGVHEEEVRAVQERLADALFRRIPAGVGSTGAIVLSDAEMDEMLVGGADWAVARGWGSARRFGPRRRNTAAWPTRGPIAFRRRRASASGTRWETLGSGNHYLEVQRVAAVYDEDRGSRVRPSRR